MPLMEQVEESPVKLGQWYQDKVTKRFFKAVKFKEEHLLEVYCSVDGTRVVNKMLFEMDVEDGDLLPCEPPVNETHVPVNSNEPFDQSLPGAQK